MNSDWPEVSSVPFNFQWLVRGVISVSQFDGSDFSCVIWTGLAQRYFYLLSIGHRLAKSILFIWIGEQLVRGCLSSGQKWLFSNSSCLSNVQSILCLSQKNITICCCRSPQWFFFTWPQHQDILLLSLSFLVGFKLKLFNNLIIRGWSFR